LSLKLRDTVVSTPMNTDAAMIVGSAAIVVRAASPITTSAPIRPAAASPSRRTSTMLSQISTSVENTTLALLATSETTARLNKDMSTLMRDNVTIPAHFDQKQERKSHGI